jgi:ferredoxin-like protein FixX
MSKGATIKIGKASISFDIEGCVDCGAKWARGWEVARRVPVTIDGRKPFEVAVHRCDECIAMRHLSDGELKAANHPLVK